MILCHIRAENLSVFLARVFKLSSSVIAGVLVTAISGI
jgi:hypothetical protein